MWDVSITPVKQARLIPCCICISCMTCIMHEVFIYPCLISLFACNIGIYRTVSFMPKGNPNPVITPAFEKARFKRSDPSTEALSDKLLCVRLTQSVDTAVRSLPNMSTWVRRVITEAAQRELMGSTTSFDYAQSKLTHQTCAELGLSGAEVRSRSKDGDV
jgi:hypothetical protein